MTFLMTSICVIIGVVYFFTALFFALDWAIEFSDRRFKFFKKYIREDKRRLYLFVFYFPSLLISIVTATIAITFFPFLWKKSSF